MYTHKKIMRGGKTKMEYDVFERINLLLEDQGKTQMELITVLGMNRSTYSNWKLGKSKSYLKRIEEIADFFGVTPDYLLRGIEGEPESKTKVATEDEMLRIFRKLSKRKQDCVMQVARTLLSE
jgi:transcriptional regulator with XRE-family HTH domain